MNKEMLRQIIENDFSIPEGMDESTAIEEVVGVLSSTDPEIRDELGYRILSTWLLERKLLTSHELERLLKESLEPLLSGIGEVESDSVFLRTFTSLLIALILYRDNGEPFLNRDVYMQTLDQLVNYCESEKDFRSFVEGKGWAHAPAHVADALDECVRNRFAGFEESSRVWEAMINLLDRVPCVFDAEEDERLATVGFSMMELGKVPQDVFYVWLNNIKMPDEYAKRVNYKNFIRSIFVRLKSKEMKVDEEIFLTLEKLFNPHFYE